MLTLFFIAPIVLIALILRAVLRPLRHARRAYTFSPYGCHRRRGGLFASFLPILLLVALERLTTRRY